MTEIRVFKRAESSSNLTQIKTDIMLTRFSVILLAASMASVQAEQDSRELQNTWEPRENFEQGPTLAERIATLEEDLAAMLLTEDGQDSRLGGIDTRNDTQDTRKDNIGVRLTGVDGRLGAKDKRNKQQGRRRRRGES